MKIGKLIALVLLGLLAVVLIYPGIPVGSGIESTNTPSGRSSIVTCYVLHWNGVHRRTIDMGDALNVNNDGCSAFAGR